MPSLPREGEEFAGYRIDREVARGGMGVVYRAEHPRLGSAVALKLLAPELAEDGSFRERFVRESRLAASISHPNIVPIYDAGEADGLLYIAMRFVDGSDLKELLREGRIPPERTLRIVAQAAQGLDAAHARGLIHRDVKPANLLIEPAGADGADHVSVADFGLTKHAESRSGVTATGHFLGTIDYMAPEQIEGRQLDARADVYALGCVVFECLTGRPPFKLDNEVATIWAHIRERPPRPSGIRRDLPPAVDDVLERALAKSPSDRFESCGDLAGALEEALGRRRRLRVPPLRRSSRLPSRARRRATVAGALLAGLAAGAVAGALLAHAGGERARVVRSGAQLTAADRLLLPYVPGAIRGSCVHAPPLDPDFSAAVSCRPGHGASSVVYNRAQSGARMRAFFVTRTNAQGFPSGPAGLLPSGYCERDASAVRDWVAVGAAGHAEAGLRVDRSLIKGRVLCYRGNGWTAIEWTDADNDVYSQAFGGNGRSVFDWWRREAGPRPAP